MRRHDVFVLTSESLPDDAVSELYEVINDFVGSVTTGDWDLVLATNKGTV